MNVLQLAGALHFGSFILIGQTCQGVHKTQTGESSKSRQQLLFVINSFDFYVYKKQARFTPAAGLPWFSFTQKYERLRK